MCASHRPVRQWCVTPRYLDVLFTAFRFSPRGDALALALAGFEFFFTPAPAAALGFRLAAGRFPLAAAAPAGPGGVAWGGGT